MARDRVMRARRRFVQAGLALAGVGLLGGCGSVSLPWQAASRIRRVGHLAGGLSNQRNEALMAAFRQGLRDLGYVEGQTLVIEERRGNGDDKLTEPAADLVRLQPEVVLVSSSTVARVAQEANATMPVVSAGAGNLVTSGLATSLAQPGGTITGLSTPFLGASSSSSSGRFSPRSRTWPCFSTRAFLTFWRASKVCMRTPRASLASSSPLWELAMSTT